MSLNAWNICSWKYLEQWKNRRSAKTRIALEADCSLSTVRFTDGTDLITEPSFAGNVILVLDQVVNKLVSQHTSRNGVVYDVLDAEPSERRDEITL